MKLTVPEKSWPLLETVKLANPEAIPLDTSVPVNKTLLLKLRVDTAINQLRIYDRSIHRNRSGKVRTR